MRSCGHGQLAFGAIVVSGIVLHVCAQGANAQPTINVWYGNTQQFGQIGTPVPIMNILGNVSSPSGMASLSYRLNGGTSRSLSMGPNNARLAEAGDFNIELPFATTPLGTNQVAITAVDTLGRSRQTTVTVINSAGPVWPLPYSVDWSTAASISSVSQIIDGLWTIDGSIVRPVVNSYDRLIAIGDTSWVNYLVTVPITLHVVNEFGYAPPAYGPALGVLLRWPGHTPDGNQPQQGVYPLGGLCMFRWTTSYERFEIFGNYGVILAHNTNDAMQLGTTYIFKARVETLSSATQYSFKWWISGQAEPSNWRLVGQQYNDPGRGCLLLLAQYVHADFGLVSVEPLNVGRLKVTLSPPEAIEAGVQWRRTNTSVWYDSGDIEAGVPVGQHTIEFKSVFGWDRPTNQTVTVAEAKTTSLDAEYSMQTGSLQTTLSPTDAVSAGARWRRLGTSTWLNSNDIESDVPVGEQAIEFKPVPGWHEPANQSVTINEDQTTTVDAAYIMQTGVLQITLTPTDAVAAGAKWRRVGTSSWLDSGDAETGIPIGEHAIEFQTVAGWHAPANQTVMIDEGQTTAVDVAYIMQTGGIQIALTPIEAVTAGVQWRRVGTFIWQPSNAVVSNVPIGEYSVEFMDIAGWTKPDPLPITVTTDQTAKGTGVYVRHPTGSLQVTISPASAIEAGAGWRFAGSADWLESGVTVGSLPIGTLTIQFNAVSGFTAPETEQVTILADQTTSIGVKYAAIVTSLENKQKFTLTVIAAGVATSPAPTLYDSGAIVEVSAPKPPNGLVFDHWSGDVTGTDNPITVVMNSDITLTANYASASAIVAPPPPFCGLGIAYGVMPVTLGLAVMARCAGSRWKLKGSIPVGR